MFDISPIEVSDDPEVIKAIAKIKGARGGRFNPIYKLLMHNPAIATAFLGQVGAVRWNMTLDGRIRELVVLRVSVLNRVDYVRAEHEAGFALEEGLTQEHFDAVIDWRKSAIFNPVQRAALAYTDAITVDIQVTPGIQDEVARHFGQRQIVELTALIGTYNMLTRMFEAFDIKGRAAQLR